MGVYLVFVCWCWVAASQEEQNHTTMVQHSALDVAEAGKHTLRTSPCSLAMCLDPEGMEEREEYSAEGSI